MVSVYNSRCQLHGEFNFMFTLGMHGSKLETNRNEMWYFLCHATNNLDWIHSDIKLDVGNILDATHEHMNVWRIFPRISELFKKKLKAFLRDRNKEHLINRFIEAQIEMETMISIFGINHFLQYIIFISICYLSTIHW